MQVTLNILLAMCVALAGNCMATANDHGNPPATRYTTSDGTPFVPQAHYPSWNWDTVHEFKAFMTEDRVLTDEEVRQLASLSNFVSMQGYHAKGVFGSAPVNALPMAHEVPRLKAANPDMKVCGYQNSVYSWRRYNARRGELNATAEEIEQLFLFDEKRGEVWYRRTPPDGLVAYDILKPTMRDWWVKRVAEMVNGSGGDGFFWDQQHGLFWERPGDPERIKARIVDAYVNLYTATRQAIGPGKLILGNNAANEPRFYALCDAVVYEHYAYEKRYRRNLQQYVIDWEQMLDVANAGKINIYVMHVDFSGTSFEGKGRRDLIADENQEAIAEIARNRMTFPLACFLIGAQPYSWFMYGWGWDTSTGALVAFPEMKKRLGKPLGPYEREPEDTWIFTRRFEHADIWIDIEKEEAKIDWK